MWRNVLPHNDRALMLLVLWGEVRLHWHWARVNLRPMRGRESIRMRLMHRRARRDVRAIGLPVVAVRVVPRLRAVVIVPVRPHCVADNGETEAHTVAVNGHRTTATRVI